MNKMKKDVISLQYEYGTLYNREKSL